MTRASALPVSHIRSASADSTGSRRSGSSSCSASRQAASRWLARGPVAAQRDQAASTRCGHSSGQRHARAARARTSASSSAALQRPWSKCSRDRTPVCQWLQIGMSRSMVNASDSSSTCSAAAEPPLLDVEVREVGVAGRRQLVEAAARAPPRSGRRSRTPRLEVARAPRSLTALTQPAAQTPAPRLPCSRGDPPGVRVARAARARSRCAGSPGSRGSPARAPYCESEAGSSRCRPPGRRAPRPAGGGRCSTRRPRTTRARPRARAASPASLPQRERRARPCRSPCPSWLVMYCS